MWQDTNVLEDLAAFSFRVKMEAALCHSPADHDLNLHCHENLKSCILVIMFFMGSNGFENRTGIAIYHVELLVIERFIILQKCGIHALIQISHSFSFTHSHTHSLSQRQRLFEIHKLLKHPFFTGHLFTSFSLQTVPLLWFNYL